MARGPGSFGLPAIHATDWFVRGRCRSVTTQVRTRQVRLAQARDHLSTRLGPLPPPSPVGATRRLRIVPAGMVQSPLPLWVPLGVCVSCPQVWYNPPPHFELYEL